MAPEESNQNQRWEGVLGWEFESFQTMKLVKSMDMLHSLAMSP